ncbi:MAG: MBL fold metallo-hydrolase [Bryobacteraceae bacterium]|nr:MBL fold metallo-hydrolase [Bryobacteraceae bacterium]
MPPLTVRFTAAGIHILEIDLWLDPRQPVAHAWFSHAHADHASGRPQQVWATSRTLELYRIRWPITTSVDQKLIPLAFGIPIEWNGAKLTAWPAGHIIGAAQLCVEKDGYRLVYTGDLKLNQPICGVKTISIECDRLIIESTFGLPIYHFLSHTEARHRILSFAQETLAEGATPVFLGYPLGRGQEIAHVLATAGIPTSVHGAMHKFLPAYEAEGYSFPGVEPYSAQTDPSRALVVVPGMRDYLEARGEVRVAYVSGWAALANARTRANAHELIPYSDHASFTELLDLVAASGASQIDIVHGYAEPFAHILRGRGYHAQAATAQMSREEDAGA